MSTTIATMISPEAEAYSRQATLDHHLANVRIAEQQFRAVCWNLLVHLASDHSGPEKPVVIVAKRGCQSVIGELSHEKGSSTVYRCAPAEDERAGLPLPDRMPAHRFTASQVTSVTEANGFITIHIA